MDYFVQSQATARAGLAFGELGDVDTAVVASGQSFAFGNPVFCDAGVENKAYNADSTDTSLIFLGVALLSHISYNTSEDTYEAYSDMNVLRTGEIWVPVASGISSGANLPAFVITDKNSADYNKYTTASGGNANVNGFFRSNANSDGLARLELK